MTKQSQVFLQGEGKQWYSRNKDKITPDDDPVLKIIEKSGIAPKNVLEIGCSNGWRLVELHRRYRCSVTGVDPMPSQDADFIVQGTADDLHLCFDEDYDLVIYGFCLYLCDREDLFRIVAEGDRVLKDEGHLIVYDFISHSPHYRPYSHKEGVKSFKMHHANLWLGNPAYRSVMSEIRDWNEIDKATSAVLMKKDLGAAWPLKKS